MIVSGSTTDRPHVSRAAFEAATGWDLKPEGACRGELCIPLTGVAAANDEHDGAGEVDVLDLAEQLSLPVVHDETEGIYAIGPSAASGRALPTAVAPELTLPDLDGNEFSLSSLRGQKVLLVAWAPY